MGQGRAREKEERGRGDRDGNQENRASQEPREELGRQVAKMAELCRNEKPGGGKGSSALGGEKSWEEPQVPTESWPGFLWDLTNKKWYFRMQESLNSTKS